MGGAAELGSFLPSWVVSAYDWAKKELTTPGEAAATPSATADTQPPIPKTTLDPDEAALQADIRRSEIEWIQMEENGNIPGYGKALISDMEGIPVTDHTKLLSVGVLPDGIRDVADEVSLFENYGEVQGIEVRFAATDKEAENLSFELVDASGSEVSGTSVASISVEKDENGVAIFSVEIMVDPGVPLEQPLYLRVNGRNAVTINAMPEEVHVAPKKTYDEKKAEEYGPRIQAASANLQQVLGQWLAITDLGRDRRLTGIEALETGELVDLSIELEQLAFVIEKERDSAKTTGKPCNEIYTSHEADTLLQWRDALTDERIKRGLSCQLQTSGDIPTGATVQVSDQRINQKYEAQRTAAISGDATQQMNAMTGVTGEGTVAGFAGNPVSALMLELGTEAPIVEAAVAGAARGAGKGGSGGWLGFLGGAVIGAGVGIGSYYYLHDKPEDEKAGQESLAAIGAAYEEGKSEALPAAQKETFDELQFYDLNSVGKPDQKATEGRTQQADSAQAGAVTGDQGGEQAQSPAPQSATPAQEPKCFIGKQEVTTGTTKPIKMGTEIRYTVSSAADPSGSLVLQGRKSGAKEDTVLPPNEGWTVTAKQTTPGQWEVVITIEEDFHSGTKKKTGNVPFAFSMGATVLPGTFVIGKAAQTQPAAVAEEAEGGRSKPLAVATKPVDSCVTNPSDPNCN
ncbi:MAG: hypothetical protein NT099_06945 [Candidatus Saganbacteria bacterium]|nr:hypothetical protein [Candidatus Saganbacteria bacterium]